MIGTPAWAWSILPLTIFVAVNLMTDLLKLH